MIIQIFSHQILYYCTLNWLLTCLIHQNKVKIIKIFDGKFHFLNISPNKNGNQHLVLDNENIRPQVYLGCLFSYLSSFFLLKKLTSFPNFPSNSCNINKGI